jgi:hypothetical protein
MRNVSASLLALASVFLLAACGQNKSPGVSEGGQKAISSDASSGFCIFDGLPLDVEKENGTLAYKSALTLGDKVTILGEPVEKTDPHFQGGKKFFFNVRLDNGNEGWVRQDFIVPNSLLAVVTSDEAVIYTQPKNTAATAKTLKKPAVIAVFRETPGQAFVKTAFYDTVTPLYLMNVYIRSEDISTNPDDVESAILVYLAGKSKNDKQKKIFLESAKRDYPSSVFASMVAKLLAALESPNAGLSTEPFAAILEASVQEADVYSLPDEEIGNIVRTLKKGEAVHVVEKTVENFTIGQMNAPWYKIDDPAGWVFGGYLQEKLEEPPSPDTGSAEPSE